MTTKKPNKSGRLRVGLVVPHIFMHRDILPRVIFSPGTLAIDLANQLIKSGADVTFFSPGPIDNVVRNVTANLSYFEKELAGRDDTYMDLLKKHPFTFVTLARQVQSELIAKAFEMANNDKLDIVHIYTNEEDIALPFAQFCKKPVVFTHHDPFNFLVKYKNVFPKYKHLNWLSMSLSQRGGMPSNTNWIGNIYHGLDKSLLTPIKNPSRDYVAFLGRIIEPKGVHFAIQAVKLYNQTAPHPVTLKIAGKHYAGHSKDAYWQSIIEPELGENVQYVGHIASVQEKQEFLGNAKALLVPSTFDEPFGMVTIEALACDTPIIGLTAGATQEIVQNGKTGFIVSKDAPDLISPAIADALTKIDTLQSGVCRQEFESKFTLERMANEHLEIYRKLMK